MAFDTVTTVGLLVLLLETFVGVMSSIFIVVVISLEFFKHHRITTSNKLIVPLCFSAICFSVMLTTNTVAGLFFPEHSQLGYVYCIYYVLNMYSFSSCSWLTSCLCFFYFIKISNARFDFLSWTKTKIDSTVPWMIVVVEAVSLCGSLINSLILVLPPKTTTNSSSVINNVIKSVITTSKYLNIIYVVNVVPFVAMILTMLLTIVSLYLHVRKMGKNISSDGSLEVHRRVVRTMVQLLILYSLFYVILFLPLFFTMTQMELQNWLYQILRSLFSPIQSAILIHSNPKFMKTLTTLYKSVSCIKCHSE